MKFYDMLQADCAVLKRKIAASRTGAGKLYYWAGMAARAVLIVAFAIVFISLLSGAFGADTTPMAVVLFCMVLSLRFVNFAYCIGDSLVTLAAALAILVLAPWAAAAAPPLLVFPLHFAAFFALLFITTLRPEMGNGGLYSFAYIYLTGNPAVGEALGRRALMAVAGYLLCAVILVVKHRHQHKTVRFGQFVRAFTLTDPAHLWQLRMALGVAVAVTAGQLLGVERFIWVGFACSSLLSVYPYSPDTSERFRQRIAGVVAGSAAFFLLYTVTPESFHSLMGPLGGVCLGFCTDYRYKTAMNCLGALMLAAGTYGLSGAVVLRVFDTLAGAVFGLVFVAVFHRLVGVRFLPRQGEPDRP